MAAPLPVRADVFQLVRQLPNSPASVLDQDAPMVSDPPREPLLCMPHTLIHTDSPTIFRLKRDE